MIVSLLKRIFHLNGHDDQWSREETGLQWRYNHPDPARSLLRARNGE
jgi:hypothetical protein